MSSASSLQLAAKLRERANRLIDTSRIGIGRALIDNCSLQEALSAIITHAQGGEIPAYVITPNAQHVVLLENDARLRRIYRNADLVVPDGMSLLFAARVFGHTLQERVAGVDLFQAVCKRSAERNLRVFLLGGRPGSADLAAEKLRHNEPTLQVKTYCPPFGFESDGAELNRIAELIRAARPHILFVALGAPKQEYWIYDHGLKLGANVCIGIGGSLEMVSGVVNRAPVWLQHIGGEWLYRLLQEPRRLWSRYLFGNLQFSAIVINQRVRRAIVRLLFSAVKSARFESELEDDKVRAEALDILLRFTATAVKAE